MLLLANSPELLPATQLQSAVDALRMNHASAEQERKEELFKHQWQKGGNETPPPQKIYLIKHFFLNILTCRPFFGGLSSRSNFCV